MTYIDPASAAAAEAANGKQLEQAIEPTGDTEVVVDSGHQHHVDNGDDADRQTAIEPIPDARANIASRFKAQRQERQEQLAAQAEAAGGEIEQVAGADAVADQQQTPRTIKVKVRHEERELTQDELIAAAQKTLAADDYLGEARKLLEDAKQVASSRPHQDGTDPAATDRKTGEADDQSHQTEDDRALAERLQFGSPEEAAEVIAQLRKAGTTDPDAIKRAVYDSQRTTDLTKARRTYDAFVKENEPLVKDPIAHAAMEAAFYNGLKDDLRKLGYADEQIPQGNEQLVEAHRFHRIQGQDVRDTAALLQDSKKAVEKFRGTKVGDIPEPPARNGNEVRVNLDRTERRAGIPLQPARSAIPGSSSTQPLPVQDARKAAVAKMAAGGRRLIRT